MGAKRPSSRDMRRLHRSLVLRALHDLGPTPRIELAGRLRLSATTITKVVAQLLEDGAVVEGLVDAA